MKNLSDALSVVTMPFELLWKRHNIGRVLPKVCWPTQVRETLQQQISQMKAMGADLSELFLLYKLTLPEAESALRA